MWTRASRARNARQQRPAPDENAEVGVALLTLTTFAIAGALVLAALL